MCGGGGRRAGSHGRAPACCCRKAQRRLPARGAGGLSGPGRRAGLCLQSAPRRSAGGPMGLPGACAPALGRPCQRDREGVPEAQRQQRVRRQRWRAGPLLPPALRRGAGSPGAGGVGGLAKFRSPVQGTFSRRDPLPSASRPPLVGLGGGQELAASRGSAWSGPQLKGDSADEMGEVCQGSRELPSVTRQGLGWMHGGQELGPTWGSLGSGPQSREHSA